MAEANGALVSLYVQRNNAIKNKGDVAGLNSKINKYVEDNEVSTAVRRASSAAASNVQSKSKGGNMSKKDIPVIAISVGMGKMKKPEKKTKMMRGGMANGKEHMYAAGGMVKDNPGLKALKAASPQAYNKITGK